MSTVLNQTRWMELREQLKDNVCEVTFTKVDGSLRTMPCTLKSDLLPEVVLTEQLRPKTVNYDVVSVWCTDKSAWRSFRVENIVSVVVLP